MRIGDDELLGLGALAEGLAHEAGALLLGYYEGAAPSAELTSSVRSKSTRTDLVTEADRASELLILDRLLAERPDDAVLAEEGGLRPGTSGLTWVVDPLDGTINFVYGFPAFAVSIACQAGDERLVGVVFDPLRDETFAAVARRGSTRNGEALKIAAGPPLSEALVATGFGYGAERRRAQARLLQGVLPEVRDIRRAGSAALDLCWLAAGRLDACYEAGLAPWDLAAGALIVTEAGGRVAVLDGLIPDASTVVAGPPLLQQELVGLLERARLAAGLPLAP
ncbi:MAG: inositol monophosphatase family protein [Acidimicrobiales bacterium]